MRLWYTEPAREWSEALPIGNGRLGGMVYGEPCRELIKLNEDSIWNGKALDRINPDALKNLPEIRSMLREGRIKEAERLAMCALSGIPDSQRAYQPAGECCLEVQNQGEVTDYERELDLEEGIVKVRFTADKTRYSREIFASYPDGVLAVCLKKEGEKGISFDCRLGRCHNWTDEVEKDENTVWFTAGCKEGGISFCVSARVRTCGGSIRTIGQTLIVENAQRAEIFLAAETSFRHENFVQACKDRLDRVMKKSYKEIRDAHCSDYQKLFRRVGLKFEREEPEIEDLPLDKRLRMIQDGKDDIGLLSLYFQYGRYLMIASSRVGSLPANLQGIWNDSLTPPWDSKFTININTEMNYWLAESGNLPECHLPLFDFIERIKENGKETARRMYGCRGSVAHHNSDIYADTAPQDLSITSTFWVMGEAWLATHVWEHYIYTKDLDFLKEHFDILEQSLLFFYDFLIEGADGTLITSPALSPENTYRTKEGVEGNLCEAAAMDIEILQELIQCYIKACRVLYKDEETVRRAQEVGDRLPKLKIGRYGQLQEWMEDYDEPEPGHRHISHLFGVYPGTTLSWRETPELMEAARCSLNRRLEYGSGHTGWSRAWITGLWAHFGEGDRVYENLKELLAEGTFPNLMDVHPIGEGAVFQIDGNFGAAAAILEMLVQSREGQAALLPALPEKLDSGSAFGICLRGGAELSMRWHEGRVSWMRLDAREDYKAVLTVNGTEEEIVIPAGQSIERRF
jgi:alpha-L-fucosidase 2